MPRLRKESIMGISILLIVCIAGISARELSPSRTERDGARVQRMKQVDWNEMESRRRKKSRPAKKQTYPNVTIPDHPPFSPDQERNVTFSPWSKDNKCQKYKNTLGKNIPPMYLVSYPRSGSSWIRYLIEGSAGFFTGSVYRDSRLYDFGYLGEHESPSDRSCLFYKDHQYRPRVVDDTTPVLFIIRNPEDVFRSFYAFRNSQNASAAFNASANAEMYRRGRGDFHEKLGARIKLWELMASILIHRSRYLHVTYYEYLKEDPIFEVKRILKFLRIPKDKKRLKCLKKSIDGYVNRGQPTFDVYTPKEKKKMRRSVKRVSDKLKGKGYPKLPYDKRD